MHDSAIDAECSPPYLFGQIRRQKHYDSGDILGLAARAKSLPLPFIQKVSLFFAATILESSEECAPSFAGKSSATPRWTTMSHADAPAAAGATSQPPIRKTNRRPRLS
jgi:hypothetical protein